MMYSKLLPMFTIIWVLETYANQFDPHLLPAAGPFFEGWYIRIIDFDTKTSFGLLFGHVLPISDKTSTDPRVLASLLYRSNCKGNNCTLNSTIAVSEFSKLNVTVKNRPVDHNPDDISPSEFKWETPFGHFMQNANMTAFQFIFGRYIFSGRIGSPVPWGPHGEGPEGWIDKLPFVPLHWFVYSLRSPLILYELTDTQTGKSVTGTKGVVHMEKNWGTSFPRGWIWTQGVSSEVSFALSGGIVALGPLTTTEYLFGYRNPSKYLTLNFRPGNSVIQTTHDGCKGVFTMTIYGLSHKVHLEAYAATSSFSDCLFGPEVTGFRPVCKESYDAIVKIIIYKKDFFIEKEIDYQTLNLSALEFGGQYMCDKKC